jgi:anti-anti-sigma factor
MPVEWSETVCVAHLADDPQFSDELESLQDRLEAAPRHCVLDLANVTFVNSSNLAQLIGLRKQLTGTGCRLMLCQVPNEVWEPIQVSGLDRLLERAESVPLALAAIQVAQHGGTGP